MFKEKETDIQRALCDYLARRRHFFWRNNNTPIFDPKRQTFRALPKYGLLGRPDIEVIKDGFYIGLEVKREKGKQSDSQKKFEQMVKEAGGEYHVVRSIDDLKEIGL